MADAVTTLLTALHTDPADEVAWRALADALEELGQPDRAELLRLHRALRSPAGRPSSRQKAERRLRALLAGGVQPCVPEVVNSVGMRLALLPPGAFLMGAPDGDREQGDEERPRHEVEITRGFYLGV